MTHTHLFWLLLVVGGVLDVAGKPIVSQVIIVERRCLIKYSLIVGEHRDPSPNSVDVFDDSLQMV